MQDTKPMVTITRTGLTAVRVTIGDRSENFNFNTLDATKKFVRKAWDKGQERFGRDEVEFVGL